MSEQQLTLFPEPHRPWSSLQRRRPRPRRAAVIPDNRGRHANSINAREAIKTDAQRRCEMIINYLVRQGPSTDRQVLNGLFPGREDMNLVRPRISDLIRVGTLIEHSEVRDPKTGRKVRRVQLTTEHTTPKEHTS